MPVGRCDDFFNSAVKTVQSFKHTKTNSVLHDNNTINKSINVMTAVFIASGLL